MITKVLDVQRRGQQLGRLRMGETLVSQKGNPYPARTDTFLFTTGSRYAAEIVGAKFGGQAGPWSVDPRQFAVLTTETAIFVTIPPRDGIVSQSYEMWNAGGAIRRCDSQRDEISGKPCSCPHAEDTGNADEVANMALRRAELAKLNPPQACKLTTRISVMIPDLPGLGVWRLDTHSYYAAVEIGDQAELMETARDQGVFLRAMLRIDQRKRIAGGKTKSYPVPVLEILDTFRDLVTGVLAAGPSAAVLQPGKPVAALTAGPAVHHQPALPTAPEPVVPLTAQQIADRILGDVSSQEFDRYAAMAREERCADDLICWREEAGGQPAEYMTLAELFIKRHAELRHGQARAS